MLLLAMGETRSNRLKLDMDKDEVEELQKALKSLGDVRSNLVESVINEYDIKRSALPMNQPQNADIRQQQEQEQARQQAQKQAARKRPARRRAAVPEDTAQGEGVSPAATHLTNIEV